MLLYEMSDMKQEEAMSLKESRDLAWRRPLKMVGQGSIPEVLACQGGAEGGPLDLIWLGS